MKITCNKYLFSFGNFKKTKIIQLICCCFSIIIFIILLSSCTNPFAPGISNSNTTDISIGDQKTIDGVFQNFRYAYTFKDTLVYGKLLSDNFTFIYRTYDDNSNTVDKSWGREEDMLTTNGLFKTAQSLDLIWNDIINPPLIADSTTKIEITRGLTLTITFSSDNIDQIQGYSNLILIRKDNNSIWQILSWRDQTYY